MTALLAVMAQHQHFPGHLFFMLVAAVAVA
jgi:hypothetical protein